MTKSEKNKQDPLALLNSGITEIKQGSSEMPYTAPSSVRQGSGAGTENPKVQKFKQQETKDKV